MVARQRSCQDGSMRRRRWFFLVVGVVAAAAVALAWFYVHEGRTKSDQWSSIIFGAIGAASVVVAALAWWWRRTVPKVEALARDDGTSHSVVRLVQQLSDATQVDCDTVAELASGRTVRLSTVYVSRQLEGELLGTLGLPSLTAVAGEAGHGKTALLWNLHRETAQAGYWPLLIPATVLLRGVEAGPGENALTIDQLWTALRTAQHGGLRPVLLIDTLDLLTHSAPARIAVHRLLTTAARIRLPMIVACRPTEAALLRLDENDNEEYGLRIRPFTLGRFSESEVDDAIDTYARACYPPAEQMAVITTVRRANIQGRALREVVANPLALRTLFELYAPEQPDPDVDGLALYDLFWQWRVATDRAVVARKAEDVVFEAGYDLSDRTQPHAFTPAATALGWLPDRLVMIDVQEAIDVLLQFARRLHQLHPSKIKWRMTIAIKWQYTISNVVLAATPIQRRELVQDLLDVDEDMAGFALRACITRTPDRPQWLYDTVARLDGQVHGKIRSTLYEYDRERSRRQWHHVRTYAETLHGNRSTPR
jgi:hypothetical protein